MAELADVMTALKNADAAGDHESAKKLAAIADKMRQEQPAAGAGGGQPEREKDLTETAKAIGASTTAGAVLGAMSPEIVTGLGMASLAVPGAGEIVGPPLIAAGRAMRATRVAEAAYGALSGAVSETGGQVAEYAGAPRWGSEAVRLALGFGTPGAAQAAKPFVSKGAKAAVGLVHLITGAENVPKAVLKARSVLSGPELAGQPQLALYNILQKGMAHDIAAANEAAARKIAEAHARAARIAATDSSAANKIIQDAHHEAAGIRQSAAARAEALKKASKGKTELAGKVLAQADKHLAEVGQVHELSDIGVTLRGKVLHNQGAAIARRQAEYQSLKQARDKAVQAREAMGVYPDQMASMQALKADLSKKLLLPGGRAAAKKADVTEAGQRAAYKNVYDAVVNRKVGKKVYPTSFDAIDAVRRKLGDAAFGREAEGYGALGQSIAKDLYSRLTKIQEEYAGPLQRQLQERYAEGTIGVKQFQGKAARPLTAADRVNPEEFQKDPAGIPKLYFKSKQGVQDLRELTGDPVMVDRAARSYAARMLEGKSSQQVANWLKAPEQRDWMREVPGLMESSQKYLKKLQQIERVGGKLEGRAGELKKAAGPLKEQAEAKSQKLLEKAREEASLRTASRVEERQTIVKEATEGAAKAREAAVKRAEAVVKDHYPTPAVEKLFTQGTPEEIRAAIRHVAGSPGGTAALEGSVRKVLARGSEKTLRVDWEEKVLPRLKEGNVLPKARMQKLQKDVEAVLRAYEPKAARGRVQALVNAALTTGGGRAAAAIAGGGYSKEGEE